MQEEKRKLAKELDKLKDQVERQSTDLRSQIVASQSWFYTIFHRNICQNINCLLEL